MDFSLTDKQHDWERRIRIFCEQDLPARPSGEQFFQRSQWEALGKIGLLGLSIPQIYGGSGLDALTTAIAMQAFGRYCHDMGLVFSAAAHMFACSMPILEFATEETRTRILPKLTSGEWVGSNAITEPDAGSDTGAMLSVAQPADNGSYRLTGFKSFAANAPIANIFVTYASTEPALGAFGLTGFVVESQIPEVKPTLPLNKSGLRSCPSGGVKFDGVLIKQCNMLGNEGQGRFIFQRAMCWERACLFASFLGMMERQLAQAIDHAKSRKQFNRPIGNNQAVSHRIVEMKTRLESARLLLYRACWGIDQNEQSYLNIALSKLAVSEAALSSSLDTVRIFGGLGYLEDNGIEIMLRDSLGSVIFSGTSDIQREIIARELGL